MLLAEIKNMTLCIYYANFATSIVHINVAIDCRQCEDVRISYLQLKCLLTCYFIKNNY
jgi:hypothetical protein